MRLVFGFLVWVMFATGATAADDPVITRLEAAWSMWAKKNGVKHGAMIVTRRGKPAYTSEINASVDQQFDLASLSKAITAVCVDALVRQGKLHYDTALADILDGPFRDPALGKATIAQLITHSAGLGPDSTQKTMVKWRGSTTPRHNQVTATVLARKKQKGPRGKHSYNNENYAVLGTVIEKVTGRPYVKACNQMVAKGKAHVSPTYGGYAPWGGWTMSLTDYASFHARNFGRFNPSQGARVAVGGNGAHYGLGTYWRSSGRASNYWHFGALCFSSRESLGAFSVSWQGNWGVVVAYDICVTGKKAANLDSVLSKAVFGG